MVELPSDVTVFAVVCDATGQWFALAPVAHELSGGMESDGWERYRIRMASRIGDRNTRMGRAAAGALQQRRAGSAKLMRED